MNPVNPSPVPALRSRRCVRHPVREAVARCVECNASFCRECVAEHGGRLLCAACLAKTTKVAAVRPKQNLAFMRRALVLVAGGLALWLSFYGAGSLLGKIPADFHDGTVWQEAHERLRIPE